MHTIIDKLAQFAPPSLKLSTLSDVFVQHVALATAVSLYQRKWDEIILELDPKSKI